jgi:small-conductance mechanosensitive channel
MSTITDWFSNLITPDNLATLVSVIIISVVAFILDRLVRRAIVQYSQRGRLDTHIENSLKLLVRIIIFVVAALIFLQVFGAQAEWLVSVSALAGAAIGFASTQTVGNLLAGVYLMLSQPFKVNDYVRIGDIEGEVREITVNYTKIYTPTFNIVEFPNRRVLDSVIHNFSDGDVIDYSFTLGFPHDVSHQELVEECIIPAINHFHDQYKEYLPRKPEFGLSKMDRLGREFSIRIHFPERNMDVFYNLQPELVGEIVNRWDIRKRKK